MDTVDEYIRALPKSKQLDAAAHYHRVQWSMAMRNPAFPQLNGFYPESTRSFATRINLVVRGQRTMVNTASCSCREPRCVHVAATLMASGEVSESLVHIESESAWERELKAVLPAERSSPILFGSQHTAVTPAPRTGSKPLALMLWTSEPDSHYRGIPLLRTASYNKDGRRSKTSPGWTPAPKTYLPAHCAVITRIGRALDHENGRYYDNRAVAVDAGYGPDLLRLLREAVDAGVSIYSDDDAQTPVRIETTAVTADLDLERTEDGLSIAPTCEGIGDGVVVGLLGSEANALIADARQANSGRARVVIWPLARPIEPAVAELLIEQHTLTVPAESIGHFEDTYLPSLLEVASVRSREQTYVLPEPPTLRLVFAVTDTDAGIEVRPHWRLGARKYRISMVDSGLPPAPAGLIDDALIASVTAASEAAFAATNIPRPGGVGVLEPRHMVGGTAIRFLGETVALLEANPDIEVDRTGGQAALSRRADAPEISLGSGAEGHDWLDLEVRVTVGEQQIPFKDVFAAISRNDPVVPCGDGTYVVLEGPEWEQLRALIEEARKLNPGPDGAVRISRYQVDLWEEFVSLGLEVSQSSAWRRTLAAVGSDATVVEVPVPESMDVTLRPYQLTGYGWLSFLFDNRLGGVLADDMGLGKTVQTLTAIVRAREAAEASAADSSATGTTPFLLVAPASVASNWVHEARKFAPQLRAVLIDATINRLGVSLTEMVDDVDIVITTYNLFRLDGDKYQEIEWAGALFDEAQALKNHHTAGYRAARELRAGFKVAITGTPFENNLTELWAILSLTCPGLLGNAAQFREYFRDPIESGADPERRKQLQQRISPFLLRRTKELVAADLPDKNMITVPVELSAEHRVRYQKQLTQERERVLGLLDDVNGNRIQILRALTTLRQLALDPALVDRDSAADDANPAPTKAKAKAAKATKATAKAATKTAVVPLPAKTAAAVDLIVEAAAEGHRTLIFSQFTRYLTSVREAATAAGIESVYLDGKSRGRDKLITEFREGTAPAFFISLKAGGTGLNLTEADYCILLDPFWNPAVEEQAIARTHRIGQTRPVIAYRLVATDTIEEKVVALRDEKQKLFTEMLDGESGGASGALSAAEIRNLLG